MSLIPMLVELGFFVCLFKPVVAAEELFQLVVAAVFAVLEQLGYPLFAQFFDQQLFDGLVDDSVPVCPALVLVGLKQDGQFVVQVEFDFSHVVHLLTLFREIITFLSIFLPLGGRKLTWINFSEKKLAILKLSKNK
ncbi:hypothetical protein [Lactobacillus delbrueckii]|uniref:hypothetical protein n=2 Tax=Lactobacillus delbrueckii TaxID=1584 RepID=UPI0015606327|nr:hypothetical protein [Lactobacillus delbrueckii]MCD5457140.1 hypothetical protein [Lactobacillus delbrueckii subsp. bulgaricus]MCD5471067.1 hypothetical protein [Lactobacillus delbrueckii subsp. bulgaricus]MCD5479398.1 hypothetical protein [Lactobacillus delbrueckii subsp. bulgaricus]